MVWFEFQNQKSHNCTRNWVNFVFGNFFSTTTWHIYYKSWTRQIILQILLSLENNTFVRIFRTKAVRVLSYNLSQCQIMSMKSWFVWWLLLSSSLSFSSFLTVCLKKKVGCVQSTWVDQLPDASTDGGGVFKVYENSMYQKFWILVQIQQISELDQFLSEFHQCFRQNYITLSKFISGKDWFGQVCRQ